MTAGTLHRISVSVLTDHVQRALVEYFHEVSELHVEDLDVPGLAAQIAARLRFGFPADDSDPTPPHGIRRPTRPEAICEATLYGLVTNVETGGRL
jgi:hypothetical protein